MDITEMYGQVLTGTVTDLNKDEAFVQIDGKTFALDLNELTEILNWGMKSVVFSMRIKPIKIK